MAKEVIMAIIPFHIVDAFATRPFTGNPAAIIPNASNLSEAEMFQITDELSMEAGFVLPPVTPGADLRLRFFTRRREAKLSGHVVIAAFASMCDRGFYRPTTTGLDLHLETGAGVLPVRLESGALGTSLITVGMPAPRFGESVSADEVAAALDVSPESLRLGDHGPQRVSCGFDQIVVPVADRLAIRGVGGDMSGILELTNQLGVGGLTLFCPETYSPEADFHCRFFHPQMGADEDIASGTSLAAAACYIVDRGLMPPAARTSLLMEQGHSLGRPTTARLTVPMGADGVGGAELTATGAVVMRGSFHFNRAALAAVF
jgi:trans-2,3-dihydro-3-hydroxyanthranilate isomerase